MQTDLKLCKGCGKYLSVSEFTISRRQSTGLQSNCKACMKARRRPSITGIPDKQKSARIDYVCKRCKALVPYVEGWLGLSEYNRVSLDEVRARQHFENRRMDEWLSRMVRPSYRIQLEVVLALGGEYTVDRFDVTRIETYCKKCLPNALKGVN